MTLRERILAVYQGHTPDLVPCMLDLSHWFYHHQRQPWDLSAAYEAPEGELIDYHKQAGVGFYMPNLGAFYSVAYPPDVEVSTEKTTRKGAPEIVWRITTPRGSIARARVWEEQTYAWAISQWGIRNQEELEVFRYAMSQRCFTPHWERYQQWVDYVGEGGLVYLPLGYSAMGHLLNYWMGVQATVYATVDYPEVLHETVDAVNTNLLELVDLACASPATVMMMGDNFSTDIQPPTFFDKWSRPFYQEAIDRLHQAGKFVAVHLDGRLKGGIRMLRDAGADAADAVTPTPMGDLSPQECRAEAGKEFILSGGVSPDLWLPQVPVERFEAKVREWLEQKETTSRFIANAGDQVPPGADESRIGLMRDLVEEHGRY